MQNFLFSLLLISATAISAEYENPYVNKHIDTHVNDFLAYEVATDFHKAIENYNADSNNTLKIVARKKFYEIKEGSNTVQFDIKFVLKGTFYYNGQLTSLQEQKELASPKTVYFPFSLISEAVAANVPVSQVMLAALLSVDEKYRELGMFQLPNTKEANIKANWANIKARIAKYQGHCNKTNDDVMASGDRNKLESFLAVMNKQKGKEESVIKDALGVVGISCEDQYSRQKTLVGKYQAGTAENDGGAEAKAVCASIQDLKTCILTVPNYHMSDSPRGYLKERTNANDDIQQYSAEGASK